jgi:CheY-like chemotaxis protein
MSRQSTSFKAPAAFQDESAMDGAAAPCYRYYSGTPWEIDFWIPRDADGGAEEPRGGRSLAKGLDLPRSAQQDPGARYHMNGSGKDLSEERVSGSDVRSKIARILFMDDTETVRSAVSEVLKLLGYEVECAVEGKELLEKYRRARDEGKPFDAVVVDLTVERGMGGREAIEKLRVLDPPARIVVSSGYPDDPVIMNYRAYGAVAYIVKPYSPSELDGILRRVLGA